MSIPQYWSIRRTPDNYKIINDWMRNRFPGSNFFSEVGYVNNKDSRTAKASLPEITFEEFKKYVLNEYVLPEKWFMRITKENIKDADAWRKSKATSHTKFNLQTWYCLVSQHLEDGSFYYSDTKPSSDYNDYEEITYEQFKTHVLNMGKEIIGYKLIKPEFEQAVRSILKSDAGWWDNHASINLKENGWNFTFIKGSTANDGSIYGTLKASGVLDLWFEPVYEEEKVIILNYEAEKTAEGVKFGCQAFDKNTLEVVKDLLSRDGAKYELTVNGEKIKLEDVEKLIKM